MFWWITLTVLGVLVLVAIFALVAGWAILRVGSDSDDFFYGDDQYYEDMGASRYPLGEECAPHSPELMRVLQEQDRLEPSATRCKIKPVE